VRAVLCSLLQNIYFSFRQTLKVNILQEENRTKGFFGTKTSNILSTVLFVGRYDLAVFSQSNFFYPYL